MVYDGAFIAEAFPALFLPLKQKRALKFSAIEDERKGIIWLNLAEWRFKNTFSFWFYTFFYLCRFERNKEI